MSEGEAEITCNHSEFQLAKHLTKKLHGDLLSNIAAFFYFSSKSSLVEESYITTACILFTPVGQSVCIQS